ncbi:MAG: hypothetical protein QOI63_1790 [Thermoplasmata archaeon]|jgi:hypothetical protein|nr:hypothetical protein [Thermoplasmata archaeon]
MQNRTLVRTALVATVAAILVLPVVWGQEDGSNAANKTSAAGSAVELLGGLNHDATATILTAPIKTSPTQDLIFSVSLECALWTTVATVGNEVSQAQATVTIQVRFDGVPVPVSGSGDDGKVVFCDRTHKQTTMNLDDDDRIEQYLATRAANAFNWLLPDVGGGDHIVEVVAELTTSHAGDEASSEAGIGHRTLMVEPTHLPQGFAL